MADFSFLSDTDDSAVEDLISQARDLCVLEQVAAINCAGFSDAVLPTDLESRFSRLKSFPATTKPKPRPSHASSARYESNFASKTHLENEDFSPAKQDPAKKMASQSKSSSGYLSSPPLDSPGEQRKSRSKAEPKRGSVSLSSNSSFSSSNSSPKSAKFSSSNRSFDKKKRFVSRPETGLFSSSKSSRESPSPPRKPGCFWCSPKKGSARKSRGDWTKSDDFGWSKNEELLADLGSFPVKEQRKILKKAMVEQKKISREAQKIVKLAKRMNVSGIEDELSDD